MAGPWEKYQSSAPADGPWAKYGATPPAEDTAGAKQPPGFLESLYEHTPIAGAVRAITHPIDTALGFIGTQAHHVQHPVEEYGELGKNAAINATFGPEEIRTGNLPGAAGAALGTTLTAAAPAMVPEGAATAIGGALRGGGRAVVNPRTFVGAYMAGRGAELMGLPAGAGEAAVVIPRVVSGAVKGARAALAERAAAAADEAAATPRPRPFVGPRTPPEAQAPVEPGKTAGDLLREEFEARPAAPAAPPPPPTPGQALAQSKGVNWSDLSAEQQTIFEQMAKATERAAETPSPRPFVGPPTPPDVQAPPPDTRSAADLLREEFERRRAAAQQNTPVNPAAPPEMIGAHDTTPVLPRAGGGPLRPPMAQPPAPVGTPPMSPQANAAMARPTKLPVTEAPRSMYTATGELKSPELRAAEAKGVNVDAKAQRWAQVIHDAGISYKDVKDIPLGSVSGSQIANGVIPGWGNIRDDLVSKGLLKAGETPPNESIPKITYYMKKIEAQEIAERLRDAMKASGTIK